MPKNLGPADFDDPTMFELAPTSLWLEDYQDLRKQLEAWRQDGVSDLKTFLLEDLRRVAACTSTMKVLKVNRRTLDLFEADSQEHLKDNLDKVFRDDMLESHVDELVQLWDGSPVFSGHSVNYTLGGARLDVALHGRVLPGYENTWARVLVALDDVTLRETARRNLAASEAYARCLFEDSPASLWVEDFSAVKHLLDDLRFQGIVDFRVFTDVHPEFVERCLREHARSVRGTRQTHAHAPP
jgi:hypothetical protein